MDFRPTDRNRFRYAEKPAPAPQAPAQTQSAQSGPPTTNPAPARPSSETKSRKKGKLKPILLVLLLAAASALGYLYWTTQQDLKDANTKLAAANKTINNLSGENLPLVQKVGRLVSLPAGEQPKIATISDIKTLQNKPFFKNAQTGDQVLIYTNAGRAVIYRPSTDKVIEYSTIIVKDNQL